MNTCIRHVTLHLRDRRGATLRPITEIAPKSPFLCAKRTGGGGYSIYPWVGRCSPAPYTLTLFKTKIADFPTLFKTEFRFLIPCLRHLTRNHTLCKTIINIETPSYSIHWQSQQNYLQLDQQSHEDLFIVQQKLIKSIPCLRQNTEKHTLAGPTSPLSPYKGVTPPPPPAQPPTQAFLGELVFNPSILGLQLTDTNVLDCF